MRNSTLLLSALLLVSGMTLETKAQVKRAVKVTSLSQLGTGSKVVIRNVGSNTARTGFVHEDSSYNLLIDNSTTSLIGLSASYVFTIADWNEGACYLTATSGKKIAGAYSDNSAPMKTVDTPDGTITLVSENSTTGTWDLKYGDSNYFNNQTNETYGPFVNTWTVDTDANASWAIYKVEMQDETTSLTDFNPEADAVYAIKAKQSGMGYATYLPGAELLAVDGETLKLCNLFTITDATDELGATVGYKIQSYADPSVYVYYLNTNNADANVGVTTDANHANLVWTISNTLSTDADTDGSFNIIPSTGSNGWNCRGTEPTYSHTAIGQWTGNNTTNNSWDIVKVTTESITASVMAYKTTYLTTDPSTFSDITSESAEKVGYPTYQSIQSYTTAYNSSDNKALLEAILPLPLKTPTSESGLYRIQNKYENLYLYQDSEANDANGLTWMNAGGTNSKYYYKVTFGEGNVATFLNANGKVPVRGPQSTPYSGCATSNIIAVPSCTLQYCETEDYFLWPNFHHSSSVNYTKSNTTYNSDTNPSFITTWPGTGEGNQYKFEPVSLNAGEQVYDVTIVNGTGSEKLTYNNSEYTGHAAVYNNGFYVLSTTPAESDFTADDREGYSKSIAIDGTTITVTYTENNVTEEEIAAALEVLNKRGVGYPTTDSDAYTTFVAAIGNPTTSSALTAATTAYKSATTGIQMPEDGKAYTFTAVNYAGNRCYMNFTGNDGYDIVSTTDENNSNYPASAILVCHKLSNEKYIFANNNGKYFIWRGVSPAGTTPTYYGYNNNKGYTDSYISEWCDLTVGKMQTGSYVSGTADQLFGYMFITGKRSSNSEQNYFVIKTESNESYTYNQANAAFFNNEYSSAILIEEATYANTPTLNTADGIDGIEAIATWSAPFPTLVPNGVTAHYIATDSEQDDIVRTTTIETGNAIPANTGVLLTGPAGQTTMVPAAAETQATIESNLLQHSAGADKTIDASENAYVLTKSEDKVAFYLLNSDSSHRTLSMNKAYLVLSDAQAAVIGMRFGGSTDILNALVPEADSQAPVYDLTGRRVTQTVKGGIYIRNGRKFIVK